MGSSRGRGCRGSEQLVGASWQDRGLGAAHGLVLSDSGRPAGPAVRTGLAGAAKGSGVSSHRGAGDSSPVGDASERRGCEEPPAPVRRMPVRLREAGIPRGHRSRGVTVPRSSEAGHGTVHQGLLFSGAGALCHLEFLAARWGNEQGSQFLLPLLEGLRRGHRSSFLTAWPPGGVQTVVRAKAMARASVETGWAGGGGLRSLRSSGEPDPRLLAGTDLRPHPALFPAPLASSCTVPHPLNRPFGNETLRQRAL